ncbi:hypothetical protein N431DRAFT_504192 [Stipitochalara longipes BDJ]|nr:hypothetical protein N431DRAFT_504192 [Stipitochalara longipes BDJ]
MRSALSLLAAIAVAYAQTSTYTDTNTGITFQGYEDATGFQFGLAVPEDPTSDFIGQMVVPLSGSGYGGVSLAGPMVGSLLIVAWPNSGSVVASFRETSGYTSPPVYTETGLSMSPLTNGTFVNSTHLLYTFLCTGCITGTALSFSANTSEPTISWAVSSKAVTNPSSSSGATLQYHDVGYGDFGLDLASAKSASYASWASMASNTSTTDSGNSTCSTSATNITATVSNTTHDYIVGGAGPAGIIVAERLAETGKSNDTITQYDVPAMDYYLTSASNTSEYCTDTANLAGCILAGGTMVNAIMFVRPQERDFDDKWPTGWKWADVSSAADQLYERNPGTTLALKDGLRYDQTAYNILLSSFSGLDWSSVDAIESPNLKYQAYSYPPWDIQDGLRAGLVKSYYPLAVAMPNFNLMLNTQVIRAVRNGLTVSGVEVENSNGSRQIINVNDGGKVILAAGAMSSPRILYNSGIGPADQINIVKNGCTSVTLPDESEWIDLPVGNNLRDHPLFTLTFNTTSQAPDMVAADFTSPNQTVVDLFAQASGPLHKGTCSSTATGSVRIKLYLTHGLTSTGVLGITSSGATEFTTNPWLNTAEDQAAIITMIDSIYAPASNSTIITPTSSSGASMVSSSAYTQGDHFVGTTMMGESNDGTAVVDTNTKVFGTDNLFVVDASIHLDLPTGNTQAIVMVVAEAAAAKIIALSSGNLTSSVISGNSTSTTDGEKC